MKKFSFYAASFAVCCMMSAAFTSCVDETEEPDYVKQVRDEKVKKELAENAAAAKAAGKESEAAFTTAALNGTLSDNSNAFYTEYQDAKTAYENAVRTRESLEKLLETPDMKEEYADALIEYQANVDAGKIALDNLKKQQDAYNKAYESEDGTDMYPATGTEGNWTEYTIQTVKYKKGEAGDDADQLFQKMCLVWAYTIGLQEASNVANQANLDMYKNKTFAVGSSTTIYSSSSYKDVYSAYLYAQQQEEVKKATYDEKKAIYDEAIEAQKKANN